MPRLLPLANTPHHEHESIPDPPSARQRRRCLRSALCHVPHPGEHQRRGQESDSYERFRKRPVFRRQSEEEQRSEYGEEDYFGPVQSPSH